MSENDTDGILNESDLERAAAIIRKGGLVAFPTETVYGLGANALDAAAVQKIYAVKGRPASSPLIVHAKDTAMARSLVRDWPPLASVLAEQFWPGPLTLVLPKTALIPDNVTAGLSSVGVRVPAHPIAAELIRRAGVPIAAPSANRFAGISPTAAHHVRSSLHEGIDMILDGGSSVVGIESTVVSLLDAQPVILRPGHVTPAKLQAVTGLVFQLGHSTGGPHQSPGLHERHYSPHTPFFVLREDAPRPPGRGCILTLPPEPQAYAAALYAALHSADSEGWDWIAVAEPAQGPEWLAVRDRLQRAGKRL